MAGPGNLGLRLINLFGDSQRSGDMGPPQAYAPEGAGSSGSPKTKTTLGSVLAKLGELGEVMSATQGNENAMRAIQARENATQQQVQWQRSRAAGLEDYEARQRIEQRYRQPDVSPMVRDANAWGGMTQEQRAAYGQMKQAGAGDPDVFITLPNGQVYAGPKSGLAAAMMGGAPASPKPVGKLTPIGGPTPPASGTFR